MTAMTPEPRENPPHPFRRLILMPWRWSRWTWAWAMPLATLVYLMSPEPAYYLLQTVDVQSRSPLVHEVICASVWPAIEVGATVKLVGAIQLWEYNLGRRRLPMSEKARLLIKAAEAPPLNPEDREEK